MSSLQTAYRTIEKSGRKLYFAWIINNLIGLISICILIYLIFWVWNPNWIIGIIVLIISMWIINSRILPYFFGIYSKPIEEIAWEAGIYLQEIGHLDEGTSITLTKTKIWNWTNIIKSNITDVVEL